MPTDQFNIGKDVSLDIIDPNQGPLRFSIRTGFDHTPLFDEVSSKGLDGFPRNESVPNGHRLTFNVDRADRALDDYFASREANYFNGGVNPKVSITETIREVDGSVSIYRFTGVSLSLQNGGTWRGNSPVTQAVQAMASRRIKVS